MSVKPFISYAREDRTIAERLATDLVKLGAEPWVDTAKLLPGQKWEGTIRTALQQSTHVILLISRSSVNKRGFVQKEIRHALEVLDELPPDSIFLIPVRLDDSEPAHEKLKQLQWVDLFADYKVAIKHIARSLGLVPTDGSTGDHPLTTPALIAEMLSICDGWPKTSAGSPVDALISNLEKKINGLRLGPQLMVCRLVLGQCFQNRHDYRAALSQFRLGQSVATRVADPYYALGGIYYDLALIDLIRRERFTLDENTLSCFVYPDERTKLLFRAVQHEYQAGSAYPFFGDLFDHDIAQTAGITHLSGILHRRSQMQSVADGAITITLNWVELMQINDWIRHFLTSPELIEKADRLVEKLLERMQHFPNEFPGSPFNLDTTGAGR